MKEQISMIFRTAFDLLFSDLGITVLLLFLTASVCSIFVGVMKRAFMPSRSSEVSKEEKEEKKSEYFDSESYIDPWEIPDKKF